MACLCPRELIIHSVSFPGTMTSRVLFLTLSTSNPHTPSEEIKNHDTRRNQIGIKENKKNKKEKKKKDKRRKPHSQPMIDNLQLGVCKGDQENEDISSPHHSIPCCCLRRSRFSCLSERSSFERTIFSGW